jgi:hypothetical protein
MASALAVRLVRRHPLRRALGTSPTAAATHHTPHSRSHRRALCSALRMPLGTSRELFGARRNVQAKIHILGGCGKRYDPSRYCRTPMPGPIPNRLGSPESGRHTERGLLFMGIPTMPTCIGRLRRLSSGLRNRLTGEPRTKFREVETSLKTSLTVRRRRRTLRRRGIDSRIFYAR